MLSQKWKIIMQVRPFWGLVLMPNTIFCVRNFLHGVWAGFILTVLPGTCSLFSNPALCPGRLTLMDFTKGILRATVKSGE